MRRRSKGHLFSLRSASLQPEPLLSITVSATSIMSVGLHYPQSSMWLHSWSHHLPWRSTMAQNIASYSSLLQQYPQQRYLSQHYSMQNSLLQYYLPEHYLPHKALPQRLAATLNCSFILGFNDTDNTYDLDYPARLTVLIWGDIMIHGWVFQGDPLNGSHERERNVLVRQNGKSFEVPGVIILTCHYQTTFHNSCNM